VVLVCVLFVAVAFVWLLPVWVVFVRLAFVWLLVVFPEGCEAFELLGVELVGCWQKEMLLRGDGQAMHLPDAK
jgi:hypothetical protein